MIFSIIFFQRVLTKRNIYNNFIADVEPENEGVIIKIQKNRKEPIKIFKIKLLQQKPRENSPWAFVKFMIFQALEHSLLFLFFSKPEWQGKQEQGNKALLSKKLL